MREVTPGEVMREVTREEVNREEVMKEGVTREEAGKEIIWGQGSGGDRHGGGRKFSFKLPIRISIYGFIRVRDLKVIDSFSNPLESTN